MKKMYLAISLIALSIAYSSSIPANAQSFWHQLKDQAFNRHGGQYGYYPQTRSYSAIYGNGNYDYLNGYNSGIYGNQQGWGQQQLQQHQLQEHQQLERQQQYFGY